MVDCALQENFHHARQFHYKLFEANELLSVENNPAGVKAFLSEMGMIENVLRLPLVPLSSLFHEKVKKAVSKLF
jgi:4-hydroxy-tetrahydrodipicolinate synthase